MIRTKNVGTIILPFSMRGAFYTTTTAILCVPFDGWISNVYIKASVTVSTTLDIDKNGTSIFATAPFINTGGTITAGILTTGTPSQVLAGDILTVEVDDVGSGAPTDLVGLITISKTNPAGVTYIADHNEVF